MRIRPHFRTARDPRQRRGIAAGPKPRLFAVNRLLHDDAALARGRAAQAAAQAVVALFGVLAGAVAAVRSEAAIRVAGAVVAGVLRRAEIALLETVAGGVAAVRRRL